MTSVSQVLADDIMAIQLTSRLTWITVVAVYIVLIVPDAPPCVAAGDIILLRNGQQLEGTIKRRPSETNDTYDIKLKQGSLVRLRASEIGRIDVPTKAEQRYAELLTAMPDTAKGHFAMAGWCHKNELKSLKQLHLEHVIRHDPDHADARRSLGHSFRRGKWGRSEDHMSGQGYERYGGNLRLPQQIELAEEKRRVELAQKKWREDVRRWRKWLAGTQAVVGKQNILAISDPLAAPGLRELLAKETDSAVREMYIDVLSRLNSPVAVEALVDVALNDGDLELRLRSIDRLPQQGKVNALDAFVRALGSKDNATVRRAAVALGRIKDERAVRPLIGALVTTHEYIVKPQANIRPSFGANSDGSAGFNGLSVGGGPKKISQQVQNPPVLDALVSITGQNFRYSAPDWRRWYIRRHSLPSTVSLRRDL